MTLPRFYCKSLTGSAAELSVSEIRHLVSVLRAAVGDKIELFDGKGSLAAARITAVKKNNVTLEIENYANYPPPTHPAVIIAASIAKGERFDWLITKLTELGVDRIIPTIFERTVKQPKNPKITDRWNNLAISAAKQCRRIFLPAIDPPAPLPVVLEKLKNDYPSARLLLGCPDDTAASLTSADFEPADTVALIGPEGGLTEDELQLAESNGCLPLRLTDTILRIETAALTFAAVLTCRRDGFKAP